MVRTARFMLLLTWLVVVGAGHAQVLPTGIAPLPQLPQLGPALTGTTDEALGDVRALSAVRSLQVRALLRAHRREVDTDPHGAPVVRGEIIAIDPTPAALLALRGAGFAVASEADLEPLQLREVSLRAPAGMDTRAAVALAQRLDPDGSYDFNHLFWRSAAAHPGPTAPATQRQPGTAATPARLVVGLIDSGIDAAHPALAGIDLKRWGCGGRWVPDAHGTAVASLLAGRAVTGAASGATLYAADVYCGQPAGGAAVGVAQALAWMARERVGVINISLVGPPNGLLARAIAAMQARGHVIVAAVGNDGPTAPPLYPAAYPGVIGISAVNARERVLPEAGRGPQVDFVAPGADMVAAAPAGRWSKVRGTSFAAPLVARIAAGMMSQPGTAAAAATLAQLTRAAVLPPGAHANAYGHGLLGITLPLVHAPSTH